MFFLPFLFSYLFFLFNKNNRAKIIKTNTARPRHPYKTRANSKNMEDWETAQETIKADINQLKDQVGQILGALKSLRVSGEASSVKGEESTHDAPIAFPTYGLPLGYTTPVGEYSKAEHASFSFPINTPRNEATYLCRTTSDCNTQAFKHNYRWWLFGQDYTTPYYADHIRWCWGNQN